MSNLVKNLPTSPYDFKNICHRFGLNSEVINYHFNNPNIKNSGYYLVVSMDQINPDVNPASIVEKQDRNQLVFYPNQFAINLSKTNIYSVFDQVMDYCRNAELISALCAEFDSPIPEKIRVDELDFLIDCNNGRNDTNLPSDTRNDYYRNVKNIVESSKKKFKGFQKKLVQQYQDGLYDDKSGKLMNFFKSSKWDNANVPLDVLIKLSGNVKKIEMKEHEYQKFLTFMKDCYHDIMFSSGEKVVADHGMINPEDNQNPKMTKEWGITVTYERYMQIIEERFATMGYEEILKYRPSYFEFRDVYYTASDESIIASVYNSIAYQFAHCDSFGTIKHRGDISISKVPANYFMNFVIDAKKNGIPFYIDNRGEFATPSFEEVTVVYNTFNEDNVNYILNSIVYDNIEHHSLSDEQRQKYLSLKQQINNAETIKTTKINQSDLKSKQPRSMLHCK